MPPVKKPVRQRRRHFIKEWRKYRELTQEQAASRIGMSAENYGRIENYRVPYNQDFLELAAEAFRCDIWDLLNRDPNKEGDVIDMVRRLNERDRAEAETFIRFLHDRKAQ